MLMDRGQGHPHLADHFEENARVVKYLSRRGVSFRYERPADLSPKRGTPLGELREKWRKELRFGLRITDPTQSVEERHDLDFETKMPLLFPLSPASNETTATAN